MVDAQGMKSQGEIEAAVCDVISRFQQEYMGRGPRDIHTRLIDNKLFVHLQGVLTPVEQRLIESHRNGNGNGNGNGSGSGNGNGTGTGSGDGDGSGDGRGAELLKQLRSYLVLTGRPLLESMIGDVTGMKPVSVHHEFSTVTGEEVIVFTLAAAPNMRDRKRK